MRVFASIATMFLPLQVISGIFGMNVQVPWQDMETINPFYGVVGFMVLVAFLFYRLFKRRNWL
jgi:magnesium transporter